MDAIELRELRDVPAHAGAILELTTRLPEWFTERGIEQLQVDIAHQQGYVSAPPIRRAGRAILQCVAGGASYLCCVTANRTTVVSFRPLSRRLDTERVSKEVLRDNINKQMGKFQLGVGPLKAGRPPAHGLGLFGRRDFRARQTTAWRLL